MNYYEKAISGFLACFMVPFIIFLIPFWFFAKFLEWGGLDLEDILDYWD